MRLVALVLLLLSGVAWSATETQFCSASVASPYATATDECGSTDAKDCCPSNLSNENSGANLTSTAFDGDVTTTVDEGTMYACARTSATSVRTCAQIQAGTGCADTSSKAVSAAGLVDFSGGDNFSGLSASTEYVIDYCHPYDSRPLDEVVSTAPVTTLAGGGGGGNDLTGLVYIVDSATGDDGDSGLTEALAWATIGKVNNSVTSLGSDVCLMDDSTFTNETLTIDWGGEAGDRVRVGTCYHNDTTGELNWYDVGDANGRGAKAKLLYTVATNNGVVFASDYVTLHSVNIDGGQGTYVAEQDSPHKLRTWWSAEGFDADFIRMEDNDMSYASDAGRPCGYSGTSGASDWVIQNNIFTECGHANADPADQGGDQGDGLDIGAGSERFLIENNTFNQAGGHTLIRTSSSNHVIRFNTLDADWSGLGAAFSGNDGNGGRGATFRSNGCGGGNQCTGLLIHGNLWDGIGDPPDAPGADYHKLQVGESIVRYNQYQSTNTDHQDEALLMDAAAGTALDISDNRIYGNHFVDLRLGTGAVAKMRTSPHTNSAARVARNIFKNNRVGAIPGGDDDAFRLNLDKRDDTGDEFDGNQWIDNCFEDADPDVWEEAHGVGDISIVPTAETNHPSNFSDNIENSACTTADLGAALTTTTGAGTSTTVTVTDSRYFFAGMTVEQGDTDEVVAADILDIGGDTCTITSIPDSTSVVCSETITWTAAEAVTIDGDETPNHGLPTGLTAGDPD